MCINLKAPKVQNSIYSRACRGWRDTNHGAKGNGPGGMVVDSNEVDEEGCATDEHRQQEGTDHHLFDPHLACNIHDTRFLQSPPPTKQPICSR